jgi:hypothetical protein
MEEECLWGVPIDNWFAVEDELWGVDVEIPGRPAGYVMR